ncbi:MAG: UDP-N-acetylglucosamine 2-epimerase (non-hydrolyzing) [Candidatus Latescibacterota bacterium]
MKIITITGTRPNFVKEYAMNRVLAERGIEEVLVHTGQHYDYELSEQFFSELKLPRPNYINTLVKGTHAWETATIMTFIEDVLSVEQPDATLVYGDVNSTLAGALASSKLRIPVAHIEAGVRSDARYNPEEINRRVTDVISDQLFAGTTSAQDNLLAEGYDPKRVHLVGDVLYDALRMACEEHGITCRQGDYDVLTVHRAENTDDETRMTDIVDAVCACGRTMRFPVHPRTEGRLKQLGLWERLQDCPHIELLPPMGFLDFLRLLAGCHKVITDSGGVRREGYMLGKPVITLIDIVWFPEIVDSGWVRVADPRDRDGMVQAMTEHDPQTERPDVFGDGYAAGRIADILKQTYG